MEMKQKISLFVPVWQRYDTICAILRAWEPQVNEMVLWNNGDQAKIKDLPKTATVINAGRNYGGQVKFMAANLLQHPLVLIADDDIKPRLGLVEDLRKHIGDNDDTVVSIFGRNLSPEGYRGHLVKGSKIEEPTQVDFIGRLYMGHRSNFLVDMNGLVDTRLDDLYWTLALRRAKPQVRLMVAPTDKWSNSENERIRDSISRMDGYWDTRNEFVQDNYSEMVRLS